MSGQQLFMTDSFRDTSKPLLSVLADEDSIFLKSLARFKHRSLYTNIINDRSAVYYTTSISRIDPYVKLDTFKINYLKGYEPVIIDSSNPISPKDEEPPLSFYQRVVGGIRSFIGRLPIMLFLAIFIPIGTVLFLLNSGVQSYRSWHRIRLHEEGKANVPKGIYRFPLMVREAQREALQTAESVYERVGALQSQEYLPESSDELETSITPLAASERGSRKTDPRERIIETGTPNGAVATPEDQQHGHLKFPTLALTPAQFTMIDNLDSVGWRKYPVYIHQARHSHAAIIVRTPRESFEEGKTVVKHWLDGFEI